MIQPITNQILNKRGPTKSHRLTAWSQRNHIEELIGGGDRPVANFHLAVWSQREAAWGQEEEIYGQ